MIIELDTEPEMGKLKLILRRSPQKEGVFCSLSNGGDLNTSSSVTTKADQSSALDSVGTDGVDVGNSNLLPDICVPLCDPLEHGSVLSSAVVSRKRKASLVADVSMLSDQVSTQNHSLPNKPSNVPWSMRSRDNKDVLDDDSSPLTLHKDEIMLEMTTTVARVRVQRLSQRRYRRSIAALQSTSAISGSMTQSSSVAASDESENPSVRPSSRASAGGGDSGRVVKTNSTALRRQKPRPGAATSRKRKTVSWGVNSVHYFNKSSLKLNEFYTESEMEKLELTIKAGQSSALDSLETDGVGLGNSNLLPDICIPLCDPLEHGPAQSSAVASRKRKASLVADVSMLSDQVSTQNRESKRRGTETRSSKSRRRFDSPPNKPPNVPWNMRSRDNKDVLDDGDDSSPLTSHNNAVPVENVFALFRVEALKKRRRADRFIAALKSSSAVSGSATQSSSVAASVESENPSVRPCSRANADNAKVPSEQQGPSVSMQQPSSSTQQQDPGSFGWEEVAAYIPNCEADNSSGAAESGKVGAVKRIYDYLTCGAPEANGSSSMASANAPSVMSFNQFASYPPPTESSMQTSEFANAGAASGNMSMDCWNGYSLPHHHSYNNSLIYYPQQTSYWSNSIHSTDQHYAFQQYPSSQFQSSNSSSFQPEQQYCGMDPFSTRSYSIQGSGDGFGEAEFPYANSSHVNFNPSDYQMPINNTIEPLAMLPTETFGGGSVNDAIAESSTVSQDVAISVACASDMELLESLDLPTQHEREDLTDINGGHFASVYDSDEDLGYVPNCDSLKGGRSYEFNSNLFTQAILCDQIDDDYQVPIEPLAMQPTETFGGGTVNDAIAENGTVSQDALIDVANSGAMPIEMESLVCSDLSPQLEREDLVDINAGRTTCDPVLNAGGVASETCAIVGNEIGDAGSSRENASVSGLMKKTLYIKGLPRKYTSASVGLLLRKAGIVCPFTVLPKPKSSFAFVEFNSPADAAEALQFCHDKALSALGKPLTVEFSENT